MSVHQSNIAMLRALGKSIAKGAKDCGDERNALLLARLSKAHTEAADDLEAQETAMRERVI